MTKTVFDKEVDKVAASVPKTSPSMIYPYASIAAKDCNLSDKEMSIAVIKRLVETKRITIDLAGESQEIINQGIFSYLESNWPAESKIQDVEIMVLTEGVGNFSWID
jgi:hypothetical protein